MARWVEGEGGGGGGGGERGETFTSLVLEREAASRDQLFGRERERERERKSCTIKDPTAKVFS